MLFENGFHCIRSRIVARQFNLTEWESTYAATPPIMLIRLLISLSTMLRSVRGLRLKIRLGDFSQAFFSPESAQEASLREASGLGHYLKD